MLVADGIAIGGGKVGGSTKVAVSSGVGVEASVGMGVGAGAAAVDKLQLNIARVTMMIPVIRLSVPLIFSSKKQSIYIAQKTGTIITIIKLYIILR
jgi:hypothetical protein